MTIGDSPSEYYRPAAVPSLIFDSRRRCTLRVHLLAHERTTARSNIATKTTIPGTKLNNAKKIHNPTRIKKLAYAAGHNVNACPRLKHDWYTMLNDFPYHSLPRYRTCSLLILLTGT
jgi:hypothetical protein